MRRDRYAEDPFQMSHCRNRPKRNQLGILSRHIFFQDFRPFNKPQPAFMNIMSEHMVLPDHAQTNQVILIGHPVDRCVSRFYYERDARGTVAHAMTIDECMARNGPCKFQVFFCVRSARLWGSSFFRDPKGMETIHVCCNGIRISYCTNARGMLI